MFVIGCGDGGVGVAASPWDASCPLVPQSVDVPVPLRRGVPGNVPHITQAERQLHGLGCEAVDEVGGATVVEACGPAVEGAGSAAALAAASGGSGGVACGDRENPDSVDGGGAGSWG